MSKKELILGAIISFVVLILLIFYIADVAELNSQYSPTLDIANKAKIIVGWMISGSTLLSLLLVIISVRKTNGQFNQLLERFTIRATIPGYFFVSLLPILAGIFLAAITGLTGWGVWLSCLSLPTIIVFFFMAMNSIKNRVVQNSGKHLEEGDGMS